MATNDDAAEVIQKRMSELRRDLATDVQQVRRSAQKIASPTYYVRRFPWVSLAVAALIGYALVPKKKQVVTPDPEMLAELVRKQEIKVDTSKASGDSQSILRSLAVMGLTWGLRTGLSYLGQRLAAAAINPNPKHEPTAEPTPPAETCSAPR